ncbi:uncharacterized protein LOC135367878 [Ornithodoros turicata]|uniref:uncharacterized protein LOC135367878 n=1 Tax=Ornithodoros turicata TaxID=34597 RepID=UPI0031387904
MKAVYLALCIFLLADLSRAQNQATPLLGAIRVWMRRPNLNFIQRPGGLISVLRPSIIRLRPGLQNLRPTFLSQAALTNLRPTLSSLVPNLPFRPAISGSFANLGSFIRRPALLQG